VRFENQYVQGVKPFMPQGDGDLEDRGVFAALLPPLSTNFGAP
jgi:hypothetical protein